MAKLYFTKLFGCILLLLSVPPTLQAQDRVLPGADGAALVQSINVPTNLYTGTANVQVPLCTLETLGGPAINIGLSYQASGIKVEDRETNVGLGWQLTGGGMVTRAIRGRPDEVGYRATSGYKHGEFLADSEYSLSKLAFEAIVEKRNKHDIVSSLYSAWESGKEQLLYELFDGTPYGDTPYFEFRLDAEPDLYYFQTPTCSGAFVIDYNGEVCLVPYQDIVIHIAKDINDAEYFEITDTSGIKYILGSTELTRERKQYQTETEVHNDEDEEIDSYTIMEAEYTSSWYLEEIVANEKTIAQYDYKRLPGIDYVQNDTIRKYEGIKEGIGEYGWWSQELKETTFITTTYYERYCPHLSKITTDYGYILFQRFDNINPPLFDRIYIQKGMAGLDYSMLYHLNYSALSDGRRCLDRIDMAYDMNPNDFKKVAEFEYHDHNVSAEDLKNYFDDWGYYNGFSNFQYRSENIYKNGRITREYRLDSYKRDAIIDSATHGTLKRIIYPTGGYKEFKYEAHNIISYTDDITFTPGGLRIKSISEFESPGKLANKTEYIYEEGRSRYGRPWHCIYLGEGVSNKHIRQHIAYRKPLNIVFSGTDTKYLEVKEVFSNGSYKIYKYGSDATNWPGGGRVKWIYPELPQEWEDESFHIVPHSANPMNWGILEEILEYTEEEKKVSHIKYNYTEAAPVKIVNANTLLHLFPLFPLSDSDHPNYFIGRYQWFSRLKRMTSIETLATDYSLPSKTTFTYTDQHPTLVRSSSTWSDAERDTLTTAIKYPFDYFTSGTSSNNQTRALHYMKAKHIINTPIETLTYNSSEGRILNGELNEFRMHGNSVVLDRKTSLHQQYPLLQGFVQLVSDEYYPIAPTSLYKTDMKYYEYTDKLLPSIYRVGDGPIQAVEYGHNGLYPIATFNNAYTEQDLQIGNRIIYLDRLTSPTTIPINWRGSDVQVSYLKKDNDKWIKHQYVLDTSNISQNSALPQVIILATTSSPVRDVVIAPQYTTYSSSTLKPGIGKTSETDVNGVSIYHEYDECGRLAKVLDKDKNVLKETVYGF